MTEPMTKGERSELAALARKRGRLAKAEVDERAQTMWAEVEDRLTHGESLEDAAYAELVAAAREAIAALNQQLAEVAEIRGVPRELWPSVTMGFNGRGSAGIGSRRAELRKTAKARLDAEVSRAKRSIDGAVLRVETELVAAGLTSEAGAQFLATMPSASELLATVDLDVPELPSWTPDPQAVSAMLAPSDRRTNQEKRAAVLAALAANPQASDRELGRLARVDHKTAGRIRGEFPKSAEEIPTHGREVSR